jgi:hypothetical protein
LVSANNSLVGSTAGDMVGYDDLIALSNGNYLVLSLGWHNHGITFAGAVTWGDGAVGTHGAVSAANSLVGSTTNDQIGYDDLKELSDGNYLVLSGYWDNASIVDAGALTWGNGASGTVGLVSAANSLVGSSANDRVSYGSVQALGNGDYVVKSFYWDNAGSADAGAISWGFRGGATRGPVSAGNSVRGLAASGGYALVYQYDATHHQLVVGRPADNIVTLFKVPYVFLPVLLK